METIPRTPKLKSQFANTVLRNVHHWEEQIRLEETEEKEAEILAAIKNEASNQKENQYKPSESINIPIKLIRDLLESNNRESLLLYIFYRYHANRQRTLQPKAENPYCMRGLHMGKTQFDRAKKVLTDKGLIKQVQKRKENSLYGEAYIRILNNRRYGIVLAEENNISEDVYDKSEMSQKPEKSTEVSKSVVRIRTVNTKGGSSYRSAPRRNAKNNYVDSNRFYKEHHQRKYYLCSDGKYRNTSHEEFPKE